MTRIDAICEIKKRFPEKPEVWAEEQLTRIEENLDGEMDDFTEIIESFFKR